MSLKEWAVKHLPPWLVPFSLWGKRARPDMPDKHALVNRQQALSIRIDRLARQDAEERRRYQAWLDEPDG